MPTTPYDIYQILTKVIQDVDGNTGVSVLYGNFHIADQKNYDAIARYNPDDTTPSQEQLRYWKIYWTNANVVRGPVAGIAGAPTQMKNTIISFVIEGLFGYDPEQASWDRFMKVSYDVFDSLNNNIIFGNYTQESDIVRTDNVSLTLNHADTEEGLNLAIHRAIITIDVTLHQTYSPS